MTKSKRIAHISLVVILISFVLLAFSVRTSKYLFIDLVISRYVQAITIPYFAEIMNFLSYSGWGIASYLTILTISVLLVCLDKRLAAFFIILNPIVEVGIFYCVAYLINRPRPTADLIRVDFAINVGGFPSGHILMYMVVYGFLIYLISIYVKKFIWKFILISVLVLLLILIGMARIYSGQHWPTDILGGYLLGGLLLWISIFLYNITRGRVRSFFPKLFPKNQEIL